MRTGHKPAPPRCALARVVGESMDKDAIKRDAWQNDGILVIDLNDPTLDMIGRGFVQSIGDKRYGKHKGGGKK